MQYRYLNGTSLKVSSVCLGTMNFGSQTKPSDSMAIMNRAHEAGINFFDTANVYTQGESEKIVGKWLKRRRHDIILATKVRGQMGENPNDAGLSRRNILAAVDASLNRLNTDYIDLYYLHMPDDQTRLEETMQTLNHLVESGKVRYVGISNYAAWQIADILALCDRHHWVRPVISQNVYNLLTRGIEAELLPCLKQHDLALAVYNPIAGGLLTGKHQPGEPTDNTRFKLNSNYYERYWSQENFRAVEKLKAVAAENDRSLLQLSLQWCHENPQVTSVICGVSQVQQLEQNIAALEGTPLDEATLLQCDAIWKEISGDRFAYNR